MGPDNQPGRPAPRASTTGDTVCQRRARHEAKRSHRPGARTGPARHAGTRHRPTWRHHHPWRGLTSGAHQPTTSTPRNNSASSPHTHAHATCVDTGEPQRWTTSCHGQSGHALTYQCTTRPTWPQHTARPAPPVAATATQTRPRLSQRVEEHEHKPRGQRKPSAPPSSILARCNNSHMSYRSKRVGG